MFIIKVNTGIQIGIMLKNTLSTINEKFLINPKNCHFF